MLLVEVLENPNKYYGQLSVGPRFLDGSMWPLQKLSRFLLQMLLSIAKRSCIPVSWASKEGAGQTRPKTLKEDSASSGVAVTDAAPLLKAGAIGRSAQYIC